MPLRLERLTIVSKSAAMRGPRWGGAMLVRSVTTGDPGGQVGGRLEGTKYRTKFDRNIGARPMMPASSPMFCCAI